MGAVPTLYIYMLLHTNPDKYDLSSMKYWISGSAPLTQNTFDSFKEKFGGEIIEEVLYDYPKISEAAVVGMKNEVYGDEIMALVVLNQGILL